jgi:hypothetical protein
MPQPDYKGTWEKRLWQFMDAVSVNLTSNDISISIVDDRTRKVRQGEIYHFGHLFPTVGIDEDADVFLKVGSNRVTVTLSTAVGAESEFRIYEGTTTTDDGTSVLTANRNRTSSLTFTSSVFHSPTVDTLGTQLTEDYFPAGVKNKEVGSSSEQTSSWILKPNTNYLLRVSNISGGIEEVSISGDIFEDLA